MFWLTAVGQSNCGPPVPCALTLGAFVSFEVVIVGSKWSLWRSSQPYNLETVRMEGGYNMNSHSIVKI